MSIQIALWRRCLRMVPVDDLVVVIDRLVRVNGSVTAADIAAEFEFPRL